MKFTFVNYSPTALNDGCANSNTNVITNPSQPVTTINNQSRSQSQTNTNNTQQKQQEKEQPQQQLQQSSQNLNTEVRTSTCDIRSPNTHTGESRKSTVIIDDTDESLQSDEHMSQSLGDGSGRFCGQCHKRGGRGHSIVCVPIVCDGTCEWPGCKIKKDQHKELKQSKRAKPEETSVSISNVLNKKVPLSVFTQDLESRVKSRLTQLEKNAIAVNATNFVSNLAVQETQRKEDELIKFTPAKRSRDEQGSVTEDNSSKKTKLDEHADGDSNKSTRMSDSLCNDSLLRDLENASFGFDFPEANEVVLQKINDLCRSVDDLKGTMDDLMKKMNRQETLFSTLVDKLSKRKQ